MAIASTDAEVLYPESDGKPMAETDQHREVMTLIIQGLQDWFVADPMVYITGNMFLYYVQGQPKFNVSPDVMVVKGVDGRRRRRTYKTWEDGKGPDLVVEVTSKSTRGEDRQKKYRLYRDKLKVREYILFDPYGEWLRPPLQGHRLIEGKYMPIVPIDGRLPSEVLGLHLEGDGENLRLFDPTMGRRVPTRLEKLEQEREARRNSDEALRQSEAEIERLRREIEALKTGKKRKRS